MRVRRKGIGLKSLTKTMRLERDRAAHPNSYSARKANSAALPKLAAARRANAMKATLKAGVVIPQEPSESEPKRKARKGSGDGGGGARAMRVRRKGIGLKSLTKTTRLERDRAAHPNSYSARKAPRAARSKLVAVRKAKTEKGGAVFAGSLKTSPGASWRAASLGFSAPNPAREFKAAVRQMKQVQRLIRQTEASLRKAELRPVRPTRPSLSSRAELWSWYRRRGLSYARFVAAHGMG